MCNHKWKTTQGIFQVWKDCELCGMKFEDFLKEGEKKVYALGGLNQQTFTAPTSGYYEVSGTVSGKLPKPWEKIPLRNPAAGIYHTSFEQACSIEFDNAIKTMQKGLESQLFYGTSIYNISVEDKETIKVNPIDYDDYYEED